MAIEQTPADIPRVWEIDWAIPEPEGGTPWEAYGWLLDAADERGLEEVTIVGATFEQLGDLDRAIAGAGQLRTKPHRYRVDGITVHGMTSRGFLSPRGAVLVAWASDEVMTEIESRRPPAVAAVASWPDRIPAWRSVYNPDRIGQVRAEQEAEYDTSIESLDQRVEDAFTSATAFVNENHSVLATDERKWIAGALIALREARVPVDREALRAHLMAQQWSGGLVDAVLQLAERIGEGANPHHHNFQLRH